MATFAQASHTKHFKIPHASQAIWKHRCIIKPLAEENLRSFARFDAGCLGTYVCPITENPVEVAIIEGVAASVGTTNTSTAEELEALRIHLWTQSAMHAPLLEPCMLESVSCRKRCLGRDVRDAQRAERI
jgi:hypothetical protein